MSAGSLQETADARELDERGRDPDCRLLRDHVTSTNVRELVREHALQLRRRRGGEQAARHGDRRPARAAAGGERTRMAVAHHVQLRLDHFGLCREPRER